MALFVNWFQTRFERKSFDLPYLETERWEDSTDLLHAHPDDQLVRVRTKENRVCVYFVTGNPVNAATVAVSIFEAQSVSARIIEHNFARYLESNGAEVTRGRWGVDAVRSVHKFDEIGLALKQGINLKYFPVADSQRQNGITLNWIVRAVFERSLEGMPSKHSYRGYPVILRWPDSAGDCPHTLGPFNGRYVGTVLNRNRDNTWTVLVRDRTEQKIRANALFLEARTDVISSLEHVLTGAVGQQSIQRRILQLSHSLRSDGRRNPGILRDQLRSALKTLDPASRGEVTIPLLPNASGKMWLNCLATGARRA